MIQIITAAPTKTTRIDIIILFNTGRSTRSISDDTDKSPSQNRVLLRKTRKNTSNTRRINQNPLLGSFINQRLNDIIKNNLRKNSRTDSALQLTMDKVTRGRILYVRTYLCMYVCTNIKIYIFIPSKFQWFPLVPVPSPSLQIPAGRLGCPAPCLSAQPRC